jgi:hypothetical protein
MKRFSILLVMACLLFGSAQARNLGPGSLQQGDMYEWVTAVKNSLLNSAKNSAGLTLGTTSTNIAIGTTVNYTINGVFLQKGLSADVKAYYKQDCGKQTSGTYRKYLVCLSTTGSITIVGGTPTTYNNAKLPAVPANKAAIGYVKVKSANSNWQIGGTGNLGSFSHANVTSYVFKNIAAIESGLYSVRENNDSYVSDDVSDNAFIWQY